MKLFLLILSVSWSISALAQDEEKKHQLNHFKACERLLSDISIEQSNIVSSQKAIAHNYKQSSTTKDASMLVKLSEASKEYSHAIKSAYGVLADIVSIYNAINCDSKDLVKELGCPEGWSTHCR